jgi:hypothetical protein
VAVITEVLLETTDDSEPEMTGAGQSVEVTHPVYVAPARFRAVRRAVDLRSG